MTLKELARRFGWPAYAALEAEVAGVTEDSRGVTPGAVFVATKGEHVDGHAFAAQARKAGAVAVVGEREGIDELDGLPYIRVPHARRALGLAAHALAGDPSQRLKVIGVTGTNGKSSVVGILGHVLESLGRSTAVFGTLGYTAGEETRAAKHTTPFGEELADLFSAALEAGLGHVVMEVSSHALDQERVAGIDFDVAVFTNLTQDHFDYHHTMEAYLDAKLKLFERVEGKDRFTVVNVDDPHAKHFLDASRVPCHTFGLKGECRAVRVGIAMKRTTFHLLSPWGEADVEMKLVGSHNVSNALAAIAVCGGLGLPMAEVVECVATLESVPGRFESIDAGQDFQVIVDYAHTEDGLRNVLTASREVCDGRVICVFGCGGDRDKGKRPAMAMAAAELAHFSIITSDNPRTEDPERILLDVETGIQRAGKKKEDDYLVLLDRAEAIETAIGLARPADLVLIAGKGHEDYQILGTRRVPFDDREVARRCLAAR